MICFTLQTKDITQKPSAGCSVSVPFLFSSSAGTNTTKRDWENFISKNTSLLPPVLQVSYQKKKKNQTPLPFTAVKGQSIEEPKVLFATPTITARSTAKPHALLTGSHNTANI